MFQQNHKEPLKQDPLRLNTQPRQALLMQAPRTLQTHKQQLKTISALGGNLIMQAEGELRQVQRQTQKQEVRRDSLSVHMEAHPAVDFIQMHKDAAMQEVEEGWEIQQRHDKPHLQKLQIQEVSEFEPPAKQLCIEKDVELHPNVQAALELHNEIKEGMAQVVNSVEKQKQELKEITKSVQKTQEQITKENETVKMLQVEKQQLLLQIKEGECTSEKLRQQNEETLDSCNMLDQHCSYVLTCLGRINSGLNVVHSKVSAVEAQTEEKHQQIRELEEQYKSTMDVLNTTLKEEEQREQDLQRTAADMKQQYEAEEQQLLAQMQASEMENEEISKQLFTQYELLQDASSKLETFAATSAEELAALNAELASHYLEERSWEEKYGAIRAVEVELPLAEEILNAVNVDIKALETEVSSAENKAQQLVKDMTELEGIITEQQAANNAVAEQISTKQQKIKKLQEELDEICGFRTEKTKQISQFAAEKSQISEELIILEKTFAAQSQRTTEHENVLQTKIANLDELISKLTSENEAVEEELTMIQEQVTAFNNENVELEKQESQVASEAIVTGNQCRDLEAEIKEVSECLAETVVQSEAGKLKLHATQQMLMDFKQKSTNNYYQHLKVVEEIKQHMFELKISDSKLMNEIQQDCAKLNEEEQKLTKEYSNKFEELNEKINKNKQLCLSLDTETTQLEMQYSIRLADETQIQEVNIKKAALEREMQYLQNEAKELEEIQKMKTNSLLEKITTLNERKETIEKGILAAKEFDYTSKQHEISQDIDKVIKTLQIKLDREQKKLVSRRIELNGVCKDVMKTTAGTAEVSLTEPASAANSVSTLKVATAENAPKSILKSSGKTPEKHVRHRSSLSM